MYLYVLMIPRSFRQGKALGTCTYSAIILAGTSPYPSNRAVTYSQDIVRLIICEFYSYEGIIQVDPALQPMSGHLHGLFSFLPILLLYIITV